MNKHYRFLLALGIAAASLSSCSRANYAVNTIAPTSQSVQIDTPASDAAASGTATVSAAMPIETVAPAREAAAVLANHAASAQTKTVNATTAIAKAPAEVAAPKVTITKAERKALRQEVKRQLATAPKSTSEDGKSQLVAALLCFFLGGLGVHDFYLGYVGKGILQIVLSILIVGFILVIIDLIRILTGSLKPKNGEYAKKL